MAVGTNSLVEVNVFMSHTLFNAGLGVQRAVDVRVHPPQRQRSVKVRRQELEVKLAALQQDYADLHTAVFEAAQVHRRLCAPRHVSFGNFEIASEIFAVRHLPGDFFTVTETNNGVILALGDICGKGLAAGMWTTHLVELVGARVAVTSKPEDIVAGVNRDICLTKSVVPLSSLFLAKLDPITGCVTYCSAGHPPALLLRASGELELLSEGGLLLGVVPAAPYVGGCFELKDGDVLMIYSDGIIESRNCAEEEFGHARLETQLRRAQTGTAEAVLFSVLGAVQDFAAASPLVDDMSLAIVRRDGR
jgi:sigma-B regulation protein RsbU (phosphoserine phosphatase)